MSERHAAALPAAEFDLQKALLVPFHVIFFVSFVALCCRGLLEVTIGKLAAYAFQAGLWTLVQFMAVTIFPCRVTRSFTIGLVCCCLFGVVAALSTEVTVNITGVTSGLIATIVNIYLLLLFVVGYGFRTEALSARIAVGCMTLLGILLPVVGFLQMVKIAMLPGESIGRMPSVTGSYLHFPLLASVLGICLLEAAKSLRRRYLYLVAVLCFVGVALSGGRSGALVFVATVGLYIIFEFPGKSRATKIKFALSVLAIIAITVAVGAAAYQYTPMLQRIAKLGSLREGGNASRILIWKAMFSYWLNTNLWLGEYAGMVGNASNNLSGGFAIVAESSTLQQLVNFGILGVIFFYSTMLFTYWAIEKNHNYLRALFVSAMIQTLFYQSTEVLPYMAILAFLPAFSQSLLRQTALPRYSNQGR